MIYTLYLPSTQMIIWLSHVYVIWSLLSEQYLIYKVIEVHHHSIDTKGASDPILEWSNLDPILDHFDPNFGSLWSNFLITLIQFYLWTNMDHTFKLWENFWPNFDKKKPTKFWKFSKLWYGDDRIKRARFAHCAWDYELTGRISIRDENLYFYDYLEWFGAVHK